MLIQFITLVIGFTGGLTFASLGIPAGGLIGAMLTVGVYKIFSLNGVVHSSTRLIGEIIVGSAIGLGFTRGLIGQFRHLLLPSLIIMVSVITFGVVTGVLLHKLTDIDLITSIFASSPGGITNMTLISDSMGADSQIVALMQFVRLISLIIVLPILTRVICKVI